MRARAGIFLGALAALLCAAGLRAQLPAELPARVVDRSIMAALFAVGKPELAGVFAFIPGEKTPVAMADLLLRDRKALKKFLKKSERELKQFGGINEWDKSVYIFLTAMTKDGAVPGTVPLPAKLLGRIHNLALAPPFSVPRAGGG